MRKMHAMAPAQQATKGLSIAIQGYRGRSLRPDHLHRISSGPGCHAGRSQLTPSGFSFLRSPAISAAGVDPMWWRPLKLIFEVPDPALTTRLAAGVKATNGRSGAIRTRGRGVGACDVTSWQRRQPRSRGRARRARTGLPPRAVAALEKAKGEKEAHGEFESRMSGLLRHPRQLLGK
jgi:hypothetical protein